MGPVEALLQLFLPNFVFFIILVTVLAVAPFLKTALIQSPTLTVSSCRSSLVYSPFLDIVSKWVPSTLQITPFHSPSSVWPLHAFQ